MNEYRDISKYNWIEAKKIIGISEGIIIPLGSIEQHGYHLPINTDSLICEKICEELCIRNEMYFYPIINYSQTWSSSDYESTIHINERKLEDYILDIIVSIYKCNPRRVIIYSFHQGNRSVIKNVLRKCYGIYPNLYYINTDNLLSKCSNLLKYPINSKIWHASEIETSLMLFLYDSLVRVENYKNYDIKIINQNIEQKWKEFNTFGSFGNLDGSSKEKGEEIFGLIVNDLSCQLNTLKHYPQKIQINLFCTDLDGTLLNDKGEIGLQTVDSIAKLQKKARICVISGRHEIFMIEIFEKIKSVDYIVSCNGSLVREVMSNKIVYKEIIEEDIFMKVIEVLKKHNYFFIIYSEKFIMCHDRLTVRKKQIIKTLSNLELNEDIVTENIDLLKKDGVLKIMIYDVRNNEELINNLPLNMVNVEIVDSNMVGIYSKKVSKGNSIKFLQFHLGIEPNKTMCCGDYLNDLSMYEFSRFKTAVSNAHENILAFANIITESNEREGIAKLINERLI